MIWLIMMLFYFSLFKYIWLIVGSPIFSVLSERTASIINGQTTSFNLKQFTTDVIRGMRMAMRNTFWQTVYILSIIFLSLLPLIGWISPIVAILVECYYYGFSMLDYTCEREKLSASKSIDFIGNHKGLAIGNGIVFYLMHCVLIVGWILAPAYAVIAATISMYEVRENRKID